MSNAFTTIGRLARIMPAVFLLAACTVYQTEGPDPDAGSDLVTICHKGTRTMRVDDAAVRAHLNHGDSLGICG